MTIQLDFLPQTEQRFTLYGISWSELEALTPLMEEHGVRLTYLDGTLELVTPSPEHEVYKSTISLLIEAYFRFAKMRFYGCGSPTFGSKELGARGEPDESYSLGAKKNVPDLAIEVVITSGGIDKLEKYRRWGVPEVWFWQNTLKQLLIYQLEGDRYNQVDKSSLLPRLNINLLVECMKIPDQYDAITTFEQSLSH